MDAYHNREDVAVKTRKKTIQQNCCVYLQLLRESCERGGSWLCMYRSFGFVEFLCLGCVPLSRTSKAIEENNGGPEHAQWAGWRELETQEARGCKAGSERGPVNRRPNER